MRIAVIASEAAPFARTGGLGDVVGALPAALARLGHDVKVYLPRYGSIDAAKFALVPLDWEATINVAGKTRPLSVEVKHDRKNGVEYFFLGNQEFFGRQNLYHDPEAGKDYDDNDERFLFFSHAVFETLKRDGFQPDIFHAHDWQAALITPLIKTVKAGDGFFAGARTVLTIHNLAYQGTFEKDSFDKLGLPADLFRATGPFEFYEKVNFLKAAIWFADKITTVSEQYAREIQSPEYGCGLDGVLQQRVEDLVGILNGVDYTVWSPSRDHKIPFKYHRANLSGKRGNKVELLRRASLPIRGKTPLIGVISRLVDQKGFDLVAAVADRLFEEDVQMIVLGSGAEMYHKFFQYLEQKYPDKCRAYLTFDDDLAHRIEAGSDIFLMPSRFEPCGLNQMYSLKYGTVPVVRRVGGLADTVEDYDEDTGAGTGFVFEEYTEDALLEALARALRLFPRKRQWTKVVKAGMAQDYSWDQSAQKYHRLFEQLVHS
ncbi:MAG: glycogen synthase GlgA [candidate division Zixibacteria bacterium]|nr:glycogen synthase GlgA [candidate division Zixibacteria bacterium]